MTTYTADTPREWREKAGSLAKKLNAEFGQLETMLSGVSVTDTTFTITKATITLAGATKINLDGPTDLTGKLTLDSTTAGNNLKIAAFGDATGLALDDDNLVGIELYPELPAAGDALTAGKVAQGIWTRFLVNKAQTNMVTLVGHEAQLRVKANLDDGVHAGLWAYFEQSGTVTLASPGLNGAISVTVEGSDGLTVDSGAYLTGMTIDSSVHDGATMDGYFDAIDIKTTSGKEKWKRGISIRANAAITGIDIGTCSSYGILMDDTYINAIRITTSVATTAYTGIRLLNTYTAADGYHVGIMGATVYDPIAGQGYGGVIGVYGEANINGNFTGGTNWSFGIRGTLQLRDDTVINNASSIFGAINASMKDDATPTLTTGHVCGVYIENLIDADLSSISGIATMLYIANNASATCTLNSAIYLYGPKITYFAQFATDCNVAGCISSDAPNAAADRYIKVGIEGSEYKVLAQSEA